MNATELSSGTNPRSTRLPGGWIVQLAPFALLVATGAYLQARWAKIPPRFPVHWGIDGRPNGWSTRTPIGVYGPLLLGTAIIAIVAASSYAIRQASRAVQSPNAGRIAHEFAHRMGIFLLALEFFLAVIFSFVGLLPLTGSPSIKIVLITVVAFLVALMFLIAWAAKGGVEQSSDLPARSDASVDAGPPDQVWKLGVFYYNPDDAALFVEKRFGIGYTLNFAHPSAWICMIVVLLLPVAALLLILSQR